jgi:hypothetical protein
MDIGHFAKIVNIRNMALAYSKEEMNAYMRKRRDGGQYEKNI